MIGRCNPFNIRYNPRSTWLGQTGCTRGFVDFDNMNYGIRAAAVLIMRSYRMKNIVTISEIIHRYAPPFENKTDAYVDFVCSQLSCFPFDIPSCDEFPRLLLAMSKFEGNPLLLSDIEFVLKKFNIVPFNVSDL